MANWNELFYDVANRKKVPETELYSFVNMLEQIFQKNNLKVWDLGCGAGRHTVALAKLGVNTFASDNAEKAVSLTDEWLNELGLKANVKLAEMTEFPFDKDGLFNGVFSWDVIQHNTLDKIQETIDLIYEKLLPGGLLIATIKSDKADLCGKGQEIEPMTFILDTGSEIGVPHHYFDEEGIRKLFSPEKWTIKALAEQIVNNVERPEKFWNYTPFRNTTWCVLMQKI